MQGYREPQGRRGELPHLREYKNARRRGPLKSGSRETESPQAVLTAVL